MFPCLGTASPPRASVICSALTSPVDVADEQLLLVVAAMFGDGSCNPLRDILEVLVVVDRLSANSVVVFDLLGC